VKRRSADGSVGITHVRVGCRQTFKLKREPSITAGLFCFVLNNLFCYFNFIVRFV
jgi:hypothetical protein